MTNIVPGVTTAGKLFANRDTVKQNLTEDLNFGRKNIRHYSNSNIADGSTNARTALAAADAEGPVVLPPGTYAIASNITLTNNVLLEPGAKLKPANGVTVTLNGGYSAEDTQHVFDLSAGGGVVVAKRSYVTPQHFGTGQAGFKAAAAVAIAAAVPLEFPGTSYSLSDLSSAFNVTGNLTIRGAGEKSLITGPNLTTHLLEVGNTSGASLVLENLNFSTFQTVANFQGNSANDAYTLTIRNCKADNFGWGFVGSGAGVYCKYSSISVDNLNLTNMGQTVAATKATGIDLSIVECPSTIINNVNVDGVGSGSHSGTVGGIMVDCSQSTDKAQSVLISNCVVKNVNSGASAAQSFGIMSLEASAAITHCFLDTIVGAASSNPEGIYTKGSNCRVSNNILLDVMGKEGCINMKGAGEVTPSKNSIVENNLISFRSGMPTETCRGIYAYDVNMSIRNNRIIGCAQAIVGFCEGLEITGNTFSGIKNVSGSACAVIEIQPTDVPNIPITFIRITDNVFENCGLVGNANTYGVLYTQAGTLNVGSVDVSNNTFVNNLGTATFGLRLLHTGTGYIDSVIYSGNVNDGTTYGLNIGTTGVEEINNIEFSNNTGYGSSDAYFYSSNAVSTGIVVKGNFLDGKPWGGDNGTSQKFVDDFGAKGDGVTDAKAAIEAADTARTGVVALPVGTYSIASNLTVTNDLKFEPGAKIKPANGVVVTCNGKIEAALDQIFDLSAGGRVILDPHVQQEVCPEWWGAVPMGEPRDRSIGPAGTNDGNGYLNVRDVVDSTAAFKAMFVAFSGPPAYGGADGYRFAVEIKMNGWYAVTDEILVHSIWFHIKGKSPAYNGSGIKWCGTIATHGGIKYWSGTHKDTAVTYSQTGTTVSGASGTFSLYDVGKKIVWTSGANSGAVATITAIISSSQVTVAETQNVAAGTIRYFRPATETSILHITACDNSVIENVGLYGKPTLVDSERILACLRFSWWPGTNVQRRIQVRNVYLNGHTDYGVETREGFLSEYGLLQGGPHSQDGNNDFHQIDNLLVGLCNHGIRIEQAQAVDWQINDYGFGYGNVMLSCKVDCIWYGKGWYAASDTWEGVLLFEGDINTVSHFKLDNFSCEHLRGHYLIRTLGSNVFGRVSGTFIQKIQGPQYRTVAVALDGSDYVATVSGGNFGTIGVPGMSNFFTPYMEGMQLNWKTGANTNATAVIDTVLGPTQAIVTGMSTGGAIASGVATLTDVGGENIFKIFDGAGAVSCQIEFNGMEFGESAVTLYQTEYPVSPIFLYRLGNTEQSTSYKFTYNSCWSPLYKSYILDTNASELYFGSTVDFVMVGCRTSTPMPGIVNRRYMNDTEDGNGRVSIASYMTDAIDSKAVDTIRFGSMLGGLENQLKTQAHRILSNTQSTITVEDFFKSGRLYTGLAAYPWAWHGNWSGGGSALVETRFGVPGDVDAWGVGVFNVANVHAKPQTVVYETDTDLVVSIVFNSARAAWTFSQTGTTVTGASGSFASTDIGKVITWTSGANSGATATIVSITSATTVEVAETQNIAAGTIEYPIALQASGYMMVQPTWLEFGLNPIQFSTVRFAEIATETLKGENLFSKTEEPNDAYWGSGELTVTTNVGNNPYGRATADKLIPSTNSSPHLINKTITGLSPNQAYTFSARVKADGYNNVLLQLGGSARYFNSSTGVAGTTSGTILASGSESLGSGWYNCWVTQLANGSGEATTVLYVCDADNNFSFAGDGTSGVQVGGMQLNPGYGPAPYLRVE